MLLLLLPLSTSSEDWEEEKGKKHVADTETMGKGPTMHSWKEGGCPWVTVLERDGEA